MRIDDWPMDRIMRLPDWCFGRRWWVGEYMGSTTGVVFYNFGDEQLPDKFVVWGVLVSCRAPNCLEALRLTIRLGDHLPVSAADAQTMERILKGISIPTICYELYVNQNAVTWINCERLLIESAGRRLALVSNGDQAIGYEMTVGVQISALPKEVPDWLSSGQDRNL